jgi:hypothetical protein
MSKLGVVLAVSLVTVGLVGCQGGSGNAAPGSSAAPGGKGAEAKAGGPKVINIPKLGLKGSAPGETEEPIIGDGEPILIAASKFTVTVGEAKATDPKTVKDAEGAAELWTPKNMKSEKLADGWVLTYENSGSAGANYFVNTRRDIGGKAYLCDTMQSTPEQQKAALDFCKSLTK